MPLGADPSTDTLLVILILLFLALFGGVLAWKLRDFIQEMKYINQEIARTIGSERKYWKREKRRLWLSLLPFYRG